MISSPALVSLHLPDHATPFIGRDSEISDIINLLEDPGCRLLTITGFGGIGKTRLATEVAIHITTVDAASQPALFPDGTYFVSLAPLTSSDLLAVTIADTLDVAVSGAKPPSDQLLAALEPKCMLLVLDNFEHVLDGKQLVSDILARAPQIKILVTSRERLLLPSEMVYDLQGMAIPVTDAVSQIEDYSALLLFEHIAHKLDWRFTLKDEQVPHVIRICRLVEGNPLAIEMAAAWVRVLSCREIADELTRNYALLEATLGHIPTRHQSMQVVFDYSWNLLTETERHIFQQISVFRGGFQREAAQQITGATLTTLLSLVDKSLLQFDSHERYHLHELLRQFSQGKLEQNPESVREVHDQHCNYFVNFLNEREMQLVTYDIASPTVAAVHADLDNIRAMWDWAIDQRHYREMERATEGLYHYYRIREAWRDATTIFQKAVTEVEAAERFPQQDTLLARLLSILSILANFCSLRDLGQETAQRGLALARTLELPIVEARCLDTIGNNAIIHGRYAEACQHLAAGVACFATGDETYEIQFVRLRLGYAYHQFGDYDRARACYHQLIFTDNQRNMDGLAAWGLDHLGHLENFLGNYAAGRQYFTEAVAIFERFGWSMGVISASKGVAEACCGLGQFDSARHYYYVALTAYVDHKAQLNVLAMLTLLGIANLLALEGDVARAIELTTFLQQHPQSPDETRNRARKLSDQLSDELAPIVFQSAQERSATRDLKTLVATFIDEFQPGQTTHNAATDKVSENELTLLQQVTEGLASGELLDEDLSKNERDSVRKLVDTVDTLLEQEKSKIMATFMESATHDLRTPLTIINTSLYLLERISDPDKRKGRLQQVKDQVTHLHTLIENLITMARFDSGAELEFQPCELNQVLLAIQQNHVSQLTPEHHLAIDFTLADMPLFINADSEYLQQALLNIIDNAIQYTPDEGKIRIALYSAACEAIVEVSDTGIGIEAEDLPHIFERFYRVDKARTDRGRSGLGLAITQKIIEAHDGLIKVTSAPDRGSTFRVSLPLMA